MTAEPWLISLAVLAVVAFAAVCFALGAWWHSMETPQTSGEPSSRWAGIQSSTASEGARGARQLLPTPPSREEMTQPEGRPS